MPSSRKKADARVSGIRSFLDAEYAAHHPSARVDVYRYNAASIRVRIIDPDFTGRDPVERNEQVWDILNRLPEDVRAEINLLLLITPAEAKRSLMNLEFEDPVPTRL